MYLFTYTYKSASEVVLVEVLFTVLENADLKYVVNT